jgi:hypothetical protein
MIPAILLALPPAADAGAIGGDLWMFDADIRQAGQEPWMEEVLVVFRAEDYFVGIAPRESAEASYSATLLAEGPIDLEACRLVHLRPGAEPPPDMPGRTILARGSIVILRLPEPTDGPVGMEGVFFVQPLRVYRVRPVSPAGPDGGG